MRITIIIPAHNEAQFLEASLNSFVAQTLQPDELVVVDDNSSDATHQIALAFAQKYSWINVYKRQSADEHIPGKKVVDAFNFGLQQASEYDLIGKFDADIILPKNYFEEMQNQFQANLKLGMCSGLLYVKNGDDWIYENIADKNHVRGPIKLYHRACFEKIGGLKPGTGWDTVDVLLAQYHGFFTETMADLKINHLRPTGHGYSQQNHQAKGAALYKMRYGIILAKIAALKMAWQAKSLWLYFRVVFGYFGAFFKKVPRFVTAPEGAFIRKLRWKGIFSKIA